MTEYQDSTNRKGDVDAEAAETVGDAQKKEKDLAAWLAIREEAGKKINPETAEVSWCYGQVLDPYNVYGPSEECDCIGRNYFARDPVTKIWVSHYDIPGHIWRAIWKKHSNSLAFPAGLPFGSNLDTCRGDSSPGEEGPQGQQTTMETMRNKR